MKKRILSLLLAVLMVVSIVPVTYAANYSNLTVTEDVTLYSGDDINDATVFTGKVIIADGATVSKGTFKGAVTVQTGGYITGGKFENTVTVEKGEETGFIVKVEASPVYGGTFNGSVTANGIINGGTFNGSVTNNNKITSGTFNGSVNNIATATINGGTYYGPVTNAGTINGGSYYNIINNSGSVGSLISAVICNTATKLTTVQNSPVIKSNVSIGGDGFTVPKSTSLTIDEGAKLTVGCTTNIAGTIYVNGSLVMNGGKGTDLSGKIYVYHGASIGGTKVKDYQYITYEQHQVKIQSNADLSEFDITVNTLYTNPTDLYLFNTATISYSIDRSAANKGCITVNSVALYKGRKADSNLMESKTTTSGTFGAEMPNDDVIIYVDCTVNHDYKETAATCTTDGYKTCSRCNHTVKTGDKLGHQFGEWVYNTDTSKKYLKSHTCTRSGCGLTEYKYVEIKGYANQEVTVDYKSTLTFNYNVSAPDGCIVQWKLNNRDPYTATGANVSTTVKEATEDFSITAIVYGSGTAMDTYTVKVHVKNGFFDKFKAFFRGLFKSLPVYVDGVKK